MPGSLWEGLQHALSTRTAPGLWEGLTQPGEIEPYSGMGTPSPAAQERFNSIATPIGNRLVDWATLPGRVAGTYNDGRLPPTLEEQMDWGAGTALGMVGGARLPGGAPAGAVGSGGSKLIQPPYGGVPNSLMGFRRSGQNVPFESQNWSYVQPVRVRLPNGDVFEDAVKGLNAKHALERARRNWEEGAVIEPIGGD